MGSPCFCNTCLRTRGTVFRCERKRLKSSAGSAASKRFFGRPSVGGGRIGGRTGDTRLLDIGRDSQWQGRFGFGEAVVGRFPRKRQRQAQESKKLIISVSRADSGRTRSRTVFY